MKRIREAMLKGNSQEFRDWTGKRAEDHRSGADRRSERRYFTDTPAIAALTPSGEWIACRVLDASRSGIRIRCDRKFQTGCEIYVMLSGGSIVIGQVRYSRAVEELFDTGLRILSHSLDSDGAAHSKLT